MEKNLSFKLKTAGLQVSSGTLSYPTFEDVKTSEYYEEIKEVYFKLGGKLSEAPVNLRKWDIEVDGAALELDEYLHFNRYRKTTLESSIYNKLPKFPHNEYLFYCKFYEDKCIGAGSYGGKWTNDSCEKQFGKGSLPKVLDRGGSPRWKQRAFYDFIKDLTPLLYDIPLIRISIYDKVQVKESKVQVKEIVELRSPYGTEGLYSLIKERM